VPDLQKAAMDDPNDYGGLRSAVVVPLGEHGVFSVGSPTPGAIGTFDTHLIEVLGTYAMVVLDRLQQEQVLRSAKEQAEWARPGRRGLEGEIGLPGQHEPRDSDAPNLDHRVCRRHW
jgi:hypothetical protein